MEGGDGKNRSNNGSNNSNSNCDQRKIEDYRENKGYNHNNKIDDKVLFKLSELYVGFYKNI